MIAIISEVKYTEDELNKLTKQGCIVNYTMIPQYYNSYSAELSRINSMLIYKAAGIIVKIDKFYASTKEAIEQALLKKKTVRIILPDAEYILHKFEDWKNSEGYGKDATSFKHPVLKLFEEQRREYFEVSKAVKKLETFKEYLDNLPEDGRQVEAFVRTFAPLYKLTDQVDYSDYGTVARAYKTINYYMDNNIPYDLDTAEIFNGAITPEESGIFTSDMFQLNYPYESPVDEIESFGDLNYMDDYVYKNEKEVTLCLQSNY